MLSSTEAYICKLVLTGYSAITAALVLFPLQISAAQVNGQFNVTVDLNTGTGGSGKQNSAFCRSDDLPGAFGATVTVVCATGAVVDISPSGRTIPGQSTHGGAARHLLHVPVYGTLRGTVDGYIGVGTVLSWRQIKLNDLDYIEILVGW